MNSWLRRFAQFIKLIVVLSRSWQKLRRYWLVRLTILELMFALLVLATVLSIRIGAVEVADDVIFSATLDHISNELDLGFNSDLDYSDRFIQRDATLIINIRWARVIMAGVVGGGLAIAGTALQGVFRNPLAEPSLIGVSSGAAVGAVIALAYSLEFTLLGYEIGTVGLAFIAGVIATALVYRLAYQQRQTNATTMLLIGVAINAIAASFIGLMSFWAGQEKVGEITFWTLGSLGAVKWSEVELTLPIVIVGSLILLFTARSLNVLALGEAEAGYLGVPVQKLRFVVIIISALITGMGVAFVGIIGFVGLVVPHILRLLFGPDYRLLLPASFLGGAIFLITMDVWARTLVKTSEMPLGVVTTLVGGPFFLLIILLNQQRGRQL